MAEYNPNIPLITDKILQSAKQMKANFNVINDTFSIDHAGLTKDPTIAGKHQQLTMRPQTLDPTTAADQIAIYNKLVATIPELFFRPANNGTPIQLTYPSISTGLASTNPDVYKTDQYSFMAGPFVIYGGKIPKVNVNDGYIKTLTPSSTLKYVFLNTLNSEINANTIVRVNAVNLLVNSFTLSFSNTFDNKFDIYYTAVGI